MPSITNLWTRWKHKRTNLTTLPNYKYGPLRDGANIRILVLKPGIGEDPIRCNLEEAKLADKPQFECLSYVWGDPTDTKLIICDKKAIRITVNLHGALKHLREPQKKRRLWVDAVCIHQENLLERNAQVAIMNRIYAAAERTLVYLGEETTEVKGALQAFQNARNLFPEEIPDPNDVGAAHFSHYGLELNQIFDAANWVAIVALMSRPWFTRRWVIQEVTVSNTAIAMCGSSSLPWKIIEETIYFILVTQVAISLPFWTRQAELGAKNLLSILLLRENDYTFADLLSQLRGFECTDPRDHFFALYSLAQDAESLPQELRPDYEVDFLKLQTSYVQWSLQQRRSLDFLSFCTHIVMKSSQPLPSWIPDFSSSIERGFITVSTLAVMHLFASRNSPSGRISDDGQTLTLVGKHLGDVELLADCFGSDEIERMRQETALDVSKASQFLAMLNNERGQWLQNCAMVAKSCDSSLSPETMLAFSRVMTWDLDNRFQKMPSHFADHFAKLIRPDFPHHNSHSEIEIVDLTTVEATMSRWAYTRRICKITGAVLASVPKNTQVGDKVCLFSGSRFPSVVRPTDDARFMLVGDCYVDGFMDGEGDKLTVESSDYTLI